MLRSQMLPALAICALLALVAPAGAGAALNLEGFPKTFPKASALCVKAGKGKLGAKLKPSKGKVLKACATLKQRYSEAYTTLTAAAAPLRQQGKDVVLQQRDACRNAKRARDPAACRQANVDARAKLKAIREQLAAVYATANRAYESARKAFWATIKSLKGGASIKPDTTVPGAPTTDVPDDSALDNA